MKELPIEFRGIIDKKEAKGIQHFSLLKTGSLSALLDEECSIVETPCMTIQIAD
jgi:hypothetical protein